jgi:hypothetical protein
MIIHHHRKRRYKKSSKNLRFFLPKLMNNHIILEKIFITNEILIGKPISSQGHQCAWLEFKSLG